LEIGPFACVENPQVGSLLETQFQKNAQMKIYSYRVEHLPDGRWSWTVFGGDQKAVSSGTAKNEHQAKLGALNAIDEQKNRD
jgi:hypothetical protein